MRTFREKYIECSKLDNRIYNGHLECYGCKLTGKICSSLNCPLDDYLSIEHQGMTTEEIKSYHDFLERFFPQKDLDPEIQRAIDEHFWELI